MMAGRRRAAHVAAPNVAARKPCRKGRQGAFRSRLAGGNREKSVPKVPVSGRAKACGGRRWH
jgi:hypothetical protein